MTGKSKIPFTKMNGLGNDFVVIDARKSGFSVTYAQTPVIADRKNKETGGCDQILVIRRPREEGDVFMEIFNADGSEVEACGNGTRAVAGYLFQSDKLERCNIETFGGVLNCEVVNVLRDNTDYGVRVNMPLPKFEWHEISLSREVADTSFVRLHDDLPPAFLVNVGNPHAVFYIENDDKRDLEDLAKEYGEKLEHHPLFLNRANINFARFSDKTGRTVAPINFVGNTNDRGGTANPDVIDLRTWERGVGLTKACGTGACATAIAFNMRTSAERIYAHIEMAGGALGIHYVSNAVLNMQGRCAFEFDGTLTL